MNDENTITNEELITKLDKILTEMDALLISLKDAKCANNIKNEIEKLSNLKLSLTEALKSAEGPAAATNAASAASDYIYIPCKYVDDERHGKGVIVVHLEHQGSKVYRLKWESEAGINIDPADLRKIATCELGLRLPLVGTGNAPENHAKFPFAETAEEKAFLCISEDHGKSKIILEGKVKQG